MGSFVGSPNDLEEKKAFNRYLTAFEEGSMPKAHCSERVKEIGNEIESLEARKATLESEDEPPSFSRQVLNDLKSNLEGNLAQSRPQDVKRLLEAFLDWIEVDSKQFVQPYYFVPAVRLVLCPRRRTEHKANRFVLCPRRRTEHKANRFTFPGEGVYLEQMA